MPDQDQPDPRTTPADRLDGTKFTVTYAGQQWTMDAAAFGSPSFVSMLDEIQEMSEMGDDDDDAGVDDIMEVVTIVSRVMRRLLGRDGGRRFMATADKASDLGEFVKGFFQAAGDQLGLPDPTGGRGPSASTPPPSKPTSDASTPPDSETGTTDA